ncbi:hypothetical protein O181_068955, partial [Austropuccinia psidii MF-1]|nr:hypothetical protein [Austropuccinia psidii MF-1]
MPEYLGLEQRSQIVGMWNAGLSIRHISEQVAIPKSTVYDTIRRFWERGTCATQPKSGQPKILNNKDCQGLDQFISENRQANLREIKEAIGKEAIGLCQPVWALDDPAVGPNNLDGRIVVWTWKEK